MAGNNALLTLARKRSKLFSICRQVINPHKNDVVAFLGMPTFSEVKIEANDLDYRSLAFLLDKEHSNLLNEISLADEKFQMIVNTLNERSKLYADQVQPRMEAAGFSPDQRYSLSKLIQILGPRIYHHLDDLTKVLLTRADETEEMLEQASSKLSVALKSKFKGKGKMIVELVTVDRLSEQEVKQHKGVKSYPPPLLSLEQWAGGGYEALNIKILSTQN